MVENGGLLLVANLEQNVVGKHRVLYLLEMLLRHCNYIDRTYIDCRLDTGNLRSIQYHVQHDFFSRTMCACLWEIKKQLCTPFVPAPLGIEPSTKLPIKYLRPHLVAYFSRHGRPERLRPVCFPPKMEQIINSPLLFLSNDHHRNEVSLYLTSSIEADSSLEAFSPSQNRPHSSIQCS